MAISGDKILQAHAPILKDTTGQEVKPVETAEELSTIAFGFMASKALFTGLHTELFTHLAEGPRSIRDLAHATQIPANRIETLTTALTAIGLLVRDGERLANAPAAQTFLSRSTRHDFGDYLRYQIDQQMYPFLLQLHAVMRDDLPDDAIASYRHWMADREQASVYSESQHAGSLGPGRTLARAVDLSQATHLLDVGGGTGAMTISLLKAYENLVSTVIDFPNVAEIGWRFVAEAGMVDRVRYIPGNAIETEWPTGEDVVLMSYLLSGVPGAAITSLLDKAMRALNAGGRVLIHDFMVEGDRTGPALAALWQLQHMAFTPDAQSLSTDRLIRLGREAGFELEQSQELIPAMTKLVVLRKPG